MSKFLASLPLSLFFLSIQLYIPSWPWTHPLASASLVLRIPNPCEYFYQCGRKGATCSLNCLVLDKLMICIVEEWNFGKIWLAGLYRWPAVLIFMGSCVVNLGLIIMQMHYESSYVWPRAVCGLLRQPLCLQPPVFPEQPLRQFRDFTYLCGYFRLGLLSTPVLEQRIGHLHPCRFDVEKC